MIRAVSRLQASMQHTSSSYSELLHARLFSKAGPSRSHKAQSVRQKRLASQVQQVVCRALQQDTESSQVLQLCGFELGDVEMSADLRRAYLFWKTNPGLQVTVEKRLKLLGKRLRSLVFSELCLPFSPSIEFVEDSPNRRAQEVEAILDKIRENEVCDAHTSVNDNEVNWLK